VSNKTAIYHENCITCPIISEMDQIGVFPFCQVYMFWNKYGL